MKFESLEKKVSGYWMIARIIIFLMGLCVFIGVSCVVIVNIKEMFIYLLIPMILITILLFIYAFVFPFLERNEYKYQIAEDRVLIKKGVLFKKYIVIPDVQIQDISYSQGPVQRLFKIANLDITTAGSTNVITCLNAKRAQEILEDLKNRIQERLTVKDE